MSISITFLAECAVIVSLGLACSKAPAQSAKSARTGSASEQAAPKSTAPTPPVATPTPPSSSAAQRSIEIRSFDCVKVEDTPDVGAQPTEHVLLSRWAAGGPAGASWNASDLTCFASVYADCTEGELTTTLTVGTHRVGSTTASITQHGLQQVTLAVPERSWRRGLDPVRKPPLPHRTALFVLRVEGSCRSPATFGPGDFPYREVSDVHAFVAGFASGE